MPKLYKISMWVIITLVILLIIALFSVPRLLIAPMIHTRIDFQRTYEADDYGLVASTVHVVTDDGLTLEAYRVDHETPRGVIIFLSGIHNPSVTAFYGHAKMVYDEGFSSILLDVRAKGNSEGDMIGLAYHEIKDVKAIVDYIKSDVAFEDLPIITYGLSMGGALAINAIGQMDDIAGAISLSAYASFTDTFIDNMSNLGFPNFYLALQRPFINQYIHHQVGRENKDIIPSEQIKNLDGRPALILHATEDDQVPFKSFERLKKTTAPNLHFHAFERSSHFILEGEQFLNPTQDEVYYQLILTFLNTYF